MKHRQAAERRLRGEEAAAPAAAVAAEGRLRGEKEEEGETGGEVAPKKEEVQRRSQETKNVFKEKTK